MPAARRRLTSGWWGEPSRPPGLGPVVAVDTSGPVDTAGLAATMAHVPGGQPVQPPA